MGEVVALDGNCSAVRWGLSPHADSRARDGLNKSVDYKLHT